MELNLDCIRDTLLFLEQHLTIDYNGCKFNSINLKTLTEDIMIKHTQYTAEDISYTVYNLHQIGFIDGNIKSVAGYQLMFCDIENITWEGHQFLNIIRPETIWIKTKSIILKTGIKSIEYVSNIAHDIMVETAKAATTSFLKGNS